MSNGLTHLTAVPADEAEAYRLCDSCHTMKLRKWFCQSTMKRKGIEAFKRIRISCDKCLREKRVRKDMS